MDEQIKANVESIFGVQFDPTHDWCSTVNGQINVYANGSSTDNIVKVQVLVINKHENDEELSYDVKILNEANIKAGEHISINFDTPMNYDNLMVAFINNKGEYLYRPFNLGDANVYYKNDTRGLTESFTLPTNTPVINGTIDSYANSRGWLPGEVLYTFDYEPMTSAGYDESFKTLFRTIIFNYFPNGKECNNLPQIMRSGYYNEKIYPITTGDDPIIVSPVYKNDGGYFEITNADLYYYYFQGDLTAEQIEALPKYKAVQLNDIYGNDDNDVIEKTKSYVLVYFGDGHPSIGTTGSYQFPQGYKIGFMYRSNTTTDKKRDGTIIENIGDKKQGELYGDGRLNYNINNWKNFKNSKLGSNDPRMAWMTVNKHMFLCVESGTDRDFNDLIIEVEGGIEPIEIIPDDPEYNFYTFCYEDHNLGDYDMNDIVLKGRRIDETHVEYTLMACGAFDDIYIYNVEGQHINHNNEAHDILNRPRGTFINVEKNGERVPFVVDVITVSKNFSFLDPTTQPYIFDNTINNTVKLSIVGQDPHAIMIPYNFLWPIEKMCIRYAYNEEDHKFNNWGQNKVTSTDWYMFPTPGKVFIY